MIGQTIRELRKEKKLSQTDLGKAIGVSQTTITAWENGKAEPTSSAVTTLANYFHVSTDYLLGRETPQKQTVDLAKDPEVLLYNGRKVSAEDMEVIKAILERHED